jgi:hypothetical protein
MEGVVPVFEMMMERGIGLDYDSKEQKKKPLPNWKSTDERNVAQLLTDFLLFLLKFDKKTKRISMRHNGLNLNIIFRNTLLSFFLGITDKEESKFEDNTFLWFHFFWIFLIFFLKFNLFFH